MARSVALWIVLVGLSVSVTGCLGNSDDEEPVGTCTEPTWDPDGPGFGRWPEPALMVSDESAPGGVRLELDEAQHAPYLEALSGFSTLLTRDLREMTGFGINAAAFFRFDGPFDPDLVPSGLATAETNTPLGLVVVDVDEPAARLVPVLVRLGDDDTTLFLYPMEPLPEDSLVAAFVTTGLSEAAGGCLRASPAMSELVSVNQSPEVLAAAAALGQLGLGVVADRDELVALTPFRTQRATAVSTAIAEDVAAQEPTLEGPMDCEPQTDFVVCEGAFEALDYRDAEGVVRQDPAAVVAGSTYRIPVTAWLPLNAPGPVPTIVFGHGLTGSRHQAERVAVLAAPRGIATVAIDALQHGDHPTNPNAGMEDTQGEAVVRFFAVGEDLGVQIIDGLALREHWRQSTYDKLQLTRILEGSPDLDADGRPDIDAERLAYFGVSLGGIMGPELLALTDAYGVSVLAVPGGRVASIVEDSPTFGPIVSLLRPRTMSEDDFARLLPVLQTVIDGGDSASYAPHVLRRREELRSAAGTAPSVLMGVVLDDPTVPNTSNYALARALDIPIAPQVLRPVPGLQEAPAGPLLENVGPGITGGLIQFDVVEQDGEVEQATHGGFADTEVAATAWFEFLESHWEDGVARIIDPYEAVGLAHSEDP